MTNQAEWANILNKATRWAFPFGYYPCLVAAMLIWGVHHEEPPSGPPAAFWVVLVLGCILVTLLFYLTVRRAIGRENRRRQHTIDLLRTSDPLQPSFIHVLKEAFVAFDTDDSGDISLNELREMLEIIFPDHDRLMMADIMLQDVKPFANFEDKFDEGTFIDAVLHAVKRLRGVSVKYAESKVEQPPCSEATKNSRMVQFFRSRRGKRDRVTPTQAQVAAWD